MAKNSIFDDEDESLEIETDEEQQQKQPKSNPVVKSKTAEKTSNVTPSTTRQLTSRQRALYSGQSETASEMILPQQEPIPVVEQESDSLVNSERKLKRKIERQEKLEMDKQATIDKLLKKPTTAKSSSSTSVSKKQKPSEGESSLPSGTIRLIENKDFSVLLCPDLSLFDQFQLKKRKQSSEDCCHFCGGKRAFSLCNNNNDNISICSSMDCYQKGKRST